VGAATTGAGQAYLFGGKLQFDSTFSQNVTFSGTDTLVLGQSQSYTGNISGFSPTGRSTFDLRDIGFVNASEATFSGTSTSGVLTVTDGAHTAHITLLGNYLSNHFVASSDGHRGTDVVGASGPASAPAHGFIAAMAGLADSAGVTALVSHSSAARDLLLAKPHAMNT